MLLCNHDFHCFFVILVNYVDIIGNMGIFQDNVNSYDNEAIHVHISKDGVTVKQDYRDDNGNQQLKEADYNNVIINNIIVTHNGNIHDDDISVSGHDVQTSYEDDDGCPRYPDVYYKSNQGRFIVIGETKATRDDLQDCTLTKNNQNHLKCQLNAYVNELVNNNDYNDYIKEIILAVPFEELSEAMKLVDSFTGDPHTTYEEYCSQLDIGFKIVTEISNAIIRKPNGYVIDDANIVSHGNMIISDGRTAPCDIITIDITNPDNKIKLMFDDNNVRTTSLTYKKNNVNQDDLYYALLSERTNAPADASDAIKRRYEIIDSGFIKDPLVVNECNGVYKIIDGNSRYANVKYICENAADPGVYRYLKIKILHNLTPDEETYLKNSEQNKTILKHATIEQSLAIKQRYDSERSEYHEKDKLWAVIFQNYKSLKHINNPSDIRTIYKAISKLVSSYPDLITDYTSSKKTFNAYMTCWRIEKDGINDVFNGTVTYDDILDFGINNPDYLNQSEFYSSFKKDNSDMQANLLKTEILNYKNNKPVSSFYEFKEKIRNMKNSSNYKVSKKIQNAMNELGDDIINKLASLKTEADFKSNGYDITNPDTIASLYANSDYFSEMAQICRDVAVKAETLNDNRKS